MRLNKSNGKRGMRIITSIKFQLMIGDWSMMGSFLVSLMR